MSFKYGGHNKTKNKSLLHSQKDIQVKMVRRNLNMTVKIHKYLQN